MVAAAVEDWRLGAFGRDCAIVFDETEEWVIGCGALANHDGFTPTGETLTNEVVLWNAPSLRVSGRVLPYDSIKSALVGTVGTDDGDAAKGEQPVLIVQDWDALHRNHPGFKDAPVDEWLGVFVHEAFHARQLWHPRMRNGGYRVDPEALAAFYDGSAPFRAAVNAEHALLAHALDDPKLDAASARRTLAAWIKLYDRRRSVFSDELKKAIPGTDPWRMDSAETFVEGTARYVEARFVTSVDDRLDAMLEGDPSFHHFAASRGKRPTQLVGLSEPDRNYFYPLGMYLSFLLDVAEPSWKEHVFDTDGLLIDQVRRSAGPSATRERRREDAGVP